ncbi:alkaline phosphatase family protein [Micromonospora zhanjiangensis]
MVTRSTTVLAAVFVLAALVLPNAGVPLSLGAFLRIPVEGLVVVALLLVLPGTPRTVLAALFGAVLGVLTVVKIVDFGFYSVLVRPFDLVRDWSLFADGYGFVRDSFGQLGAVGAATAAVVLAVGVPVLMTLAALRLARVVRRHRRPAAGTAGALAAAWVVCAVFGAQLVPGAPVAASSAAGLAYGRTLQVRDGLRDRQVFAGEAAVDAFKEADTDRLLSGLRGKDVIVSFVESYGRSAVEDPEISPRVDAALAAGTERLNAAGYASRSGWLTSPTAGGGSWLAQATLLSGLWIDNQQRFNDLVTSDRLTLTSAFKKADWRTVGVMPGITAAWPEGSFYGYDQVYDSRKLGYKGPSFGWSPMPDQYTLATFQRAERGRTDRPPLMAAIPLTSSHAPWVPLPRSVDWHEVGDGSIYGPMEAAGKNIDDVWPDPHKIRAEYAKSVEYSLDTLVSYVEKYGDDNLVLVFLGDHQPVPVVTGAGAGRDVPITIVARDPAVLNRIAGWGWQDGLKPSPQSPVWRMDAFRDRFLTAFGTPGAAARSRH